SVAGYWRQQTPEYKAKKKAYDAECRKLKKMKVWEQAVALRAFRRAFNELVEAHAQPEIYGWRDRERLVHMLGDALERVAAKGAWCDHCRSLECVHCISDTHPATWLARARREA